MSQLPSGTFVVTDPIEIVRAMVGLKDVRVLAYIRRGPDVELMIEQVVAEIRCPVCEGRAQVKERPVVHYVDLPVYAHPMSLAWKKHRIRCVNPGCAKGTFVLGDHRIAAKTACSPLGPPSGPRSKSASGAPSQKWPPSWPVTGTPSTTRSPPMARPCWRPIANG